MQLVDSIVAALVTLLFLSPFISVDFFSASDSSVIPGLLTYHNSISQVFWTVLLAVPFAFRRTKPQKAAAGFVIIAFLQLLFGPVFLSLDLFAIPMLYSVLVYGKPQYSKRFIILALLMCVYTGLIFSFQILYTPLLEPSEGTLLDEFNQSVSSTTFANFIVSWFSVAIPLSLVLLTVIIATIIAGYWSRARLATVRMMRERNEALQLKQEEEQHIAALAERSRIARDMHDVVAHTLSMIIIQSDGGRYAGAHNPSVAYETMTTIRRESEHALHDLGIVLGTLGGSVHSNWHDIDALLDQARQVSTDSTFSRTTQGEPHPELFSEQTSSALYRVVQEALSNIRKYAGQRVNIVISEQWRVSDYRIEIRDNGRGASANLDGHTPGFGLQGMKERIEAVGGTVTAGPQLSGGFCVHASVPLNISVTSEKFEQPSQSIQSTQQSQTLQPTVPMQQIVPAQQTKAINGGSTAITQQNVSLTQQIDRTHVSEQRIAQPATKSDTPNAADYSVTLPTEQYAASFDQPTLSLPPNAPSSSVLPTQWQSPERLIRSLRHHPLAVALQKRVKTVNWSFFTDGTERINVQQADVTRKLNIVEQISRWCERHYVIVDALMCVAIFLFSQIGGFTVEIGTAVTTDDLQGSSFIVYELFALATLSPLAFRRRFPWASCMGVAVASVLQLLFTPIIAPYNVLGVCISLYSIALYGTKHKWVIAWIVSLVCSVMVGIRLTFLSTKSNELTSYRTFLIAFMVNAIAMAALCTIMLFLGHLTRVTGSNTLVLKARQEALEAQQEKMLMLAANMERERISSQIREEVTYTLTQVIDQAIAGLTMLEEYQKQGVQPPSERITQAFSDIGVQGRKALAHMRQLLGVLRQTEESTGQHIDAMRLRPAASLEEQVQAAQGVKPEQ